MVLGGVVFQLPALAAVGAGITLASWAAVVVILLKSQQLRQSHALVFTPNVVPFGIFATLVGGSLFALGVGSSDYAALVCMILPLMVGLILTLMQLPALAITVADEQGLASHSPLSSRTLRWADVDWVYGVQSTAMSRNRRVSYLNRATVMDSKYIVEAGPGQRIAIPLHSGGDQRVANDLLKTITAHTGHAIRGERQLAQVRARRAQRKSQAAAR